MTKAGNTNEMNYQIKNNHGHYELYIDGIFHCSADTISEIVTELQNCSKQYERSNT